jgi:hypothetical protein
MEGSLEKGCRRRAAAQRVGHGAGGWRLSELEAFEVDVGGPEVGEVVVGLLGEPGFGAAAEDFGEADGHFGGDAALSVDQFGERGASDAESRGGLRDR